MKGIQFDNAAQRKSYVGCVYEAGTEAMRARVLAHLPERLATLHREGRIHIHDLEAYGQTYNCLQLDVLRGFPWERFHAYSHSRKIGEIFCYFKNVIAALGNEQSGGIGFPNFDDELQHLFEKLEIPCDGMHLSRLTEELVSFMDWLNYARERCGQVTYYVSLNIGLSTGVVGRHCTRQLLCHMRDSGADVIKPNLVFKVKSGVSFCSDDPNYDLYCLAVESTCRKMIPTYLLFDSSVNREYDPRAVAIMGCRTKVVADLYGAPRSIGRGNLAYVTINLPGLALEVSSANGRASVEAKAKAFEAAWEETAAACKDVLQDRYARLLRLEAADFPANLAFGLWMCDFVSDAKVEEVFRHGTLSIGFIGLAEAVEVLTGQKLHASSEAYAVALELVKFMRRTVDRYRDESKLNFTLLATSGEFISGKFPGLDRRRFEHPVLEKGFYTNSFHVEVDSGLHPFEKLRLEGPFHALANGGCISYVELASAPIGNDEAVKDTIRSAAESGINYMGLNFPLDTCRDCSTEGTFEACPRCGSADVLRIRRVSGYLEDLDYFTPGKAAEVTRRRPNVA